MKSMKLQINGMTCNGCAVAIENVLKMKGLVKETKVDFDSKTAAVEFDETKVEKLDIINAVKEAGYKVEEA